MAFTLFVKPDFSDFVAPLFILWAASRAGVEITEFAFLVVLRVLIKLFFSIAMVSTCSFLEIS